MGRQGDTIAAVATPAGPGAIGILRLSGPGAADIAAACFRPLGRKGLLDHPTRTLVYGSLLDCEGQVIDQVLCTYSRGPASYTGEDTAELHCHGSPMVLSLGLEALFAQGARQAAGQLSGALSRKIAAIYSALVDVMAHFHAVLDYPDEDIDPFTQEQLARDLEAQRQDLEALLSTYQRGRRLSRGVKCAIVGRPNAGKSSLLNTLAGYDRAIVTDIPGTTRDTVEETVELGGIPLRLIDTAGLRDSSDPIEQLGVERSRRAMEEAELILVVLDQSQPAREEDAALIRAAVERAPTIVVLNKQDLPCQLEWTEPLDLAASVPICAKTGAGLDGLAELVAQTFPRDPGSGYGELLTNQRQAEAAGRALESVRRAGEALDLGVTPDALLTDVEEALSALGELTGQSVRDDVTDRIFQRFCVGK